VTDFDAAFAEALKAGTFEPALRDMLKLPASAPTSTKSIAAGLRALLDIEKRYPKVIDAAVEKRLSVDGLMTFTKKHQAEHKP
jgi:hypothetical protein